jgi:hypothetical protein
MMKIASRYPQEIKEPFPQVAIVIKYWPCAKQELTMLISLPVHGRQTTRPSNFSGVQHCYSVKPFLADQAALTLEVNGMHVHGPAQALHNHCNFNPFSLIIHLGRLLC